ncbi:GGDEF domain-containing protein [Oribacterium sp. WCC10]|uniref:GGDEF domain-containing protein n=1 Tax=Oribacterium sp. WCC10 TaxID=1855343 RepID=UPI0008EDFC56|nr:GGDEF domain-containing protein [Oribacterium sp. WCC10]SFG30391.1 diguanylate cyclase (GGDEF) domain-containing protein [Oribacterium sp. WCC10]
MEKKRINRPLKRSIQYGCISFVVVLCLLLGINIYFNYKNLFIKESQDHIRQIINYVIGYIDNDDLKRCMETKTESQKYKDMMVFLDDVKEDLDPQYLYVIKPLRENGGNHVLIVVSAENNYDRYEDTEGNIYLGDITEDEYTKEEVDDLHRIMGEKEIVFMESKTYWGHSYCGYYALRDSSGVLYALLGVDIDLTQMSQDILYRTLTNLILIILTGAVFIVGFITWASKNITDPIEMLEKSAIGYIKKSREVSSPDKLIFEKPDLNIHNEVESLSNTINQMTEDMKDYMFRIISAEKETVHMKEVASTDSLTGLRNKRAYDEKVKQINKLIEGQLINEFGIIMMDVNFLKKINDTYGHRYGDILIQNFCSVVCDIFVHSPVYRIGGDEFVIILQKKDLANADCLIKNFEKALSECAAGDNAEPWEALSAAFGVAYFDRKKDKSVEDVFRRADEAMYQRKKEMKAERSE